MISRVASLIAQGMFRKGIIPEEEIDLYNYGFF